MRKLLAAGVLLIGLDAATGAAYAAPTCAPLNLPPATAQNSVTFGNTISYALPLLGIDYKTGPGQIQDCVVNGTGASGTGVTTNPAGFDNAYPTPSGTGGLPYFSTGDATTPPAAPNNMFLGQSPTTWDMQVGALTSFLGTGNVPIFMFNLNQVNSGAAENQKEFLWAQLVVKTATGTVVSPYFYFSAVTNNTGLPNFGIPGGDPTTFLGTQTAATNTYPVGTDPSGTFPLGGPCGDPSVVGSPSCGTSGQYMVQAQGAVCLDGPVGVGVPVPCGSPGAGNPINLNLGANDAAFAAVIPNLDALLASLAPTDVIQIDFRMGCNPDTIGPFVGTPSSQSGLSACPAGSPLNNGFEQLFIIPGMTNIPEPSTLLVFAFGLIALGAYSRRLLRG
jgi:hypothetical protein